MAPGASLRKVRQPALHNILQPVETSNPSLSSLSYLPYFYRNVSCTALCIVKCTVHYLVFSSFIHPLCSGVLSVLSHFQWICFVKRKVHVLLGRTSTKHDRTWPTMYSLQSCVTLYSIHIGPCISVGTSSYTIRNDVWFTPVFIQFLCPGMFKAHRVSLASRRITSTTGRENIGYFHATGQTNVCLFVCLLTSRSQCTFSVSRHFDAHCSENFGRAFSGSHLCLRPGYSAASRCV